MIQGGTTGKLGKDAPVVVLDNLHEGGYAVIGYQAMIHVPDQIPNSSQINTVELIVVSQDSSKSTLHVVCSSISILLYNKVFCIHMYNCNCIFSCQWNQQDYFLPKLSKWLPGKCGLFLAHTYSHWEANDIRVWVFHHWRRFKLQVKIRNTVVEFRLTGFCYQSILCTNIV